MTPFKSVKDRGKYLIQTLPADDNSPQLPPQPQETDALAIPSGVVSSDDLELVRPGSVIGLTVVLLMLSGLASLWIGQVWPAMSMSLVFSLGLRFYPPAVAVRRIYEIFALGFAVIFLLNIIGASFFFIYKSLIALALIGLALLDKKGLRRAYIRRSLFFNQIRLCTLLALAFIGITFLVSMRHRTEYPLPDLHLGLLLLVGIGGSMLNAASEEVIYRGVLMSRLEEAGGSKFAILIQGIIFLVAHFWTKVPMGLVALAIIFVFGMTMGWLVKRTQGLFAAIYVHFLVDLGMFTLVLLHG